MGGDREANVTYALSGALTIQESAPNGVGRLEQFL